MKSQIILGVDPGYDRLGWAVGLAQNRSLELIACGLVQTKRTDTFFRRFEEISDALDDVISKYKPEFLALETLIAAVNASTVVPVAQVRGLVISKALHAGMSIGEYAPSQVKVAVTGYGRASKAEVTKMVEVLTKHSLSKYKDDTVDAVAIAITGSVIG